MLEDGDDAAPQATLRFALAVASVAWYCILWSLGLLGCWSA